MPRKERKGQPKKQVSLDLQRYQTLVAELREVRAEVPVDDKQEALLIDAMDVAWAGMNDWDRKMASRQDGEWLGQNPQRALDLPDPEE